MSDRSRTTARSLDAGLSGDWNGTTGKISGKGNVGSSTTTNGAGATSRSENIELSVAAVVTEVLPNGNLLISGSQEVRVNAEMRILTIAGIVRPTDIGPENTVPYERIAEARISYGGVAASPRFSSRPMVSRSSTRSFPSDRMIER